MAKLSAHDEEIARYVDGAGGLRSVRSDGVTLRRTVWTGWKLHCRKKAAVPLAEWRAERESAMAGLRAREPWRFQRSLPSRADLARWESDTVCETPSGETVEHDGHTKSGEPSWLRLLLLI